jgi:hypothetical protein
MVAAGLHRDKAAHALAEAGGDNWSGGGEIGQDDPRFPIVTPALSRGPPGFLTKGKEGGSRVKPGMTAVLGAIAQD